MHIIDWLGSPAQRSIGISMMRQVHQGVETQFGLGVSESALGVGERAGYELRGLVPVYTRVLRAGYWLRAAGSGRIARWLRLARDLSTRAARLPARPRTTLILDQVARFGSEISEIVASTKAHAILTERDPARLNSFLHFPRQNFSGWHLRDPAGGLRGFALLSLVSQDGGPLAWANRRLSDARFRLFLLAGGYPGAHRRAQATTSRRGSVLRFNAVGG